MPIRKRIMFADSRAVSFANRTHDSPADEPTNSTGYSLQLSRNQSTAGRTLVQSFPRGTYYLLSDGFTGQVQLWRIDDVSVDLGIIGPAAIAGRPFSDVSEAPKANPPGPIASLDRASPGTRAGLAAAAEARRTNDRLREINRRNAEFWQGQR